MRDRTLTTRAPARRATAAPLDALASTRRATLAVLAVLAAALPALGCAGPTRPGEDRATTAAPPIPSAIDPDTASAPPAATAVDHVDPAAIATARAFALAARTWSPTTLRAHWRRQLTLSTGELRTTLRASAPTTTDLARLHADHASATATLLDLTPTAATSDTTRLILRLTERITTAGTTTAQTTANRIDLIRHGTTWRVTAFTLAGG